MDGDHILCCICEAGVPRERWFDAFTWMDPGGQTCVAHRGCLARLGEFELGLDVESPW